MKKFAYLCVFAGAVSLLGMKSASSEEEEEKKGDLLAPKRSLIEFLGTLKDTTKEKTHKKEEEKCAELVGDMDFVTYIFSQDECVIPCFYDLFRVILRQCGGDVEQAKTRVCDIIAYKKSMLGDMDVWFLIKRMVEGIPMDSDVSMVFESIECMHVLSSLSDRGRKLLDFIAYFDKNFIPEDYIIINCMFHFFVHCPFFNTMSEKAPNFDAFKFGFLTIRFFCKATPYNFSREKILTLCDTFLSQFFTIVKNNPSILTYAAEAIPALFVLKEQGMSYDKASEAVLALFDKNFERVSACGEFIGFDASLPVEKVEGEERYEPFKISLMLIANGINHHPDVRKLFQVAKKRFGEVVFGKADFENFAISIFDSLFYALLKSTSSKNALNCIRAAILLLDDSIIPNNDSLIYEKNIENDPWKEIIGSLSEETPPTDEEMAEWLEGIIVERESLFVCDYEIIAEIIIKLRELRYRFSLQTFIEFYPQLSDFIYEIKEFFFEPIAFHLKWLGRAYEQICQYSLEEAKAIYDESRNMK